MPSFSASSPQQPVQPYASHQNHVEPWQPGSLATQSGVPEQFVIPENVRRPLGAHPTDVRGRGYVLAFGGLVSAVFSIGAVIFLALGAAGLSLVPAVLGIVLGIMALRRTRPSDPQSFYRRARLMAIGAIVVGAIGTILSIGAMILSVWLFSEISDCSAYEPGTTEYQECQNPPSNTSIF